MKESTSMRSRALRCAQLGLTHHYSTHIDVLAAVKRPRKHIACIVDSNGIGCSGHIDRALLCVARALLDDLVEHSMG